MAFCKMSTIRSCGVMVLLTVGLLLLALNSGSMDTVSRSSLIDWKSINLEAEDSEPLTKAKLDEIKENNIKDKSSKILNIDVAYKECSPTTGQTGKTILLLHGAAFKSQTWVDQVPTMQTLCHHDHRVIAIDLPGYGNTGPLRNCRPNTCDKADFLLEFVKAAMPGEKPVIVSPSMSGTFSLPFLEKHQELVDGFIPVAPVGTGQYRDFLETGLVVPTLIVYGQKDTSLGTSSARDLQRVATATKPYVLKGARHPAYLDQPHKWHQILLNFLKYLSAEN